METIKKFLQKIRSIFTKSILEEPKKDLEKEMQELQEIETRQENLDEIMSNLHKEMDELREVINQQNPMEDEEFDDKKVREVLRSEKFNANNFPTEISEEQIYMAAKQTGGVNNFTRLLWTGQIFKQADMEPIYLANKDESIIRVAARETWNKPLH